MVLGLSLGPRCGPSGNVDVHSPRDGEILVTGVVAVDASAGRQLDGTTLVLEIEGVDLAAALGLAPPFSDESGMTSVAGDVVTVTGFTIETPAQGPHVVQATIAGLSPGTFGLIVSGEVSDSMELRSAAADVIVVESLTLEAVDVPAAGLPGGAVALPTQGVLGNASLGQPLAAPPIATQGGGSIRSGHVEVAEGLIAGGGS
jgi:hypothetical protein